MRRKRRREKLGLEPRARWKDLPDRRADAAATGRRRAAHAIELQCAVSLRIILGKQSDTKRGPCRRVEVGQRTRVRAQIGTLVN